MTCTVIVYVSFVSLRHMLLDCLLEVLQYLSVIIVLPVDERVAAAMMEGQLTF